MIFINTIRSAAATLALILFFGSSAHASSVSLDFQDWVNDDTLTLGTIITDQYSVDGVDFSLANTADGPIIDSFLTPETGGLFNTFNFGSAIIATFSQQVNTISFSSIIDTPLTATAYDEFGTVLASATVGGGTSDVGSLTTIDNIAWLELLNDSGTGYAGNDNLTTISMLSFGVTAVPIPAAAWLLISGLLSIFGFAKGRRRITAPNAQIA